MKKKTGLRKNPLLEATERVKKREKTPTIEPIEPIEQPLTLAAFYFLPEQLKELERIRFELSQKYNLKISKSAIMRVALELIIEQKEKIVEKLRK
jgi:hypothetical protein